MAILKVRSPTTGRGMKLFVAGASESDDAVREVARRLERAGHSAQRWNQPGALKLGCDIRSELKSLSKTMDGGVFVVDDQTGSPAAPRDNVLFEYGLFLGALGPENVTLVEVGDAQLPADVANITRPQLLRTRTGRLRERSPGEWAKLLSWSLSLCPNYVRRFGFDLAEDLVTSGKPAKVEDILRTHAPELMDNQPGHTILAVCSDKGRFSHAYYARQFAWVAQKSAHMLRRVFISRTKGSSFSPDEIKAILQHHDEPARIRRPRSIQFRHVREDDHALGGVFADSLGFALFGRSWMLHWGLRTGFYHDATKEQDRGTGRVLRARFTALWRQASEFSAREIRKLRARQKVRAKRARKGKRLSRAVSPRAASGSSQPPQPRSRTRSPGRSRATRPAGRRQKAPP